MISALTLNPMGGIISCIATQTACCFGNAALNCFCNLCGGRSSTASRVGYSLLFLLSAILSWLLMAQKLNLHCPDPSKCTGILAVYRVCFASSVFHLIMALTTYGVTSTKDWRSNIQNGYWAVKIIVYFL